MATDCTEILERLRAGITELTTSERWTAWLQVAQRFHHYSFGNVLLIQAQFPGASRVAGFHSWRKLGRSVRRGEKGIAILAPIFRRMRVQEEDGEEQIIAAAPRAFRVVHVFDESQTEGAALPERPCWRLSGDDPADHYTRLVRVAHALGYTVEEDYLPGECNGDCDFAQRRIRVEVANEPVQQVRTLAHELGHALLHDGFAGPRELMELEAESVAFVVMSTLGVDAGDYSFGYCAGWAGGGSAAVNAITASGQRIVRGAGQILDGGLVTDEAAA